MLLLLHFGTSFFRQTNVAPIKWTCVGATKICDYCLSFHCHLSLYPKKKKEEEEEITNFKYMFRTTPSVNSLWIQI